MTHFDCDGRLRADAAVLTVGGVTEYYGREIPDSKKHGLDPNRLYRMLRPPAELHEAAHLFANLPILVKHVPRSTMAFDEDVLAGALGDRIQLSRNRLFGDVQIWAPHAIRDLLSGKARDLSCSYDYETVWRSGTFNGERFDGFMKNIRPHHIAVVDEGRLGPAVRLPLPR